ncbi:uncharacterized protein STEHIDRAFT_168983 [Stereum hirsutum FP-91666 SS1]|uniref:uncharacterized protein n=1 Tax=Stereum hirsutum (strain FP-91666) TaxID=721885 RepID=UPI00044495E0|nr:uncharacterized protein STEHIDRAFT_168983 [Stereum hirsutum FP-91666 SS1]EIM85956.1 hypothetical protein STEHIDRAFT_168983 [Stereum hirsutum FP-91666 SS1]
MTAVRPLLVVILTGFGFLWLWWSWSSTGTTVTAVLPSIVRASTSVVDEYPTHHDEDLRLSSPTALPTKNTTSTSTTSPPSPSPSRYINFSELLFPEHGTDGTARPWIGANHRTLRTLFECIELGTCGENQEKVVLLGTSFFYEVLNGAVGGESIWAASIMQVLTNMGYTYLLVQDLSQAVYYHHMLPSLIRTIILQDDLVQKCASDAEFCARSPRNPHGIPLWKILAFHFWGGNIHPLGWTYTLSPEPYSLLSPSSSPSSPSSVNTYIGYSIESTCTTIPFVPHSERPNQAWVLAKLLTYMSPNLDRPAWHPTPAWTGAIMDRAAGETGVRYLFGARDDTGVDDTGVEEGGDADREREKEREEERERKRPDMPSRENYENVGQRPREEFVRELARSRVLIGVGNPLISPTPYEALCLGVPFINPLYDVCLPSFLPSFLPLNPDPLPPDPSPPNPSPPIDIDLPPYDLNAQDPNKMPAQQPFLSVLGPPYVYHVHHGDEEGFVNAVREALDNPIDRYILDRMRLSEIEKRLQAVLEWDREMEQEQEEVADS